MNIVAVVAGNIIVVAARFETTTPWCQWTRAKKDCAAILAIFIAVVGQYVICVRLEQLRA